MLLTKAFESTNMSSFILRLPRRSVDLRTVELTCSPSTVYRFDCSLDFRCYELRPFDFSSLQVLETLPLREITFGLLRRFCRLISFENELQIMLLLVTLLDLYLCELLFLLSSICSPYAHLTLGISIAPSFGIIEDSTSCLGRVDSPSLSAMRKV